MTVTPDQARALLDGIDNTPWRAIKSDFKIDPTGIVRDAEDETIGAAEGGHVDPDFTHGQADLIAAAPDLAQTVIEQGEKIKRLKDSIVAVLQADEDDYYGLLEAKDMLSRAALRAGIIAEEDARESD